MPLYLVRSAAVVRARDENEAALFVETALDAIDGDASVEVIGEVVVPPGTVG